MAVDFFTYNAKVIKVLEIGQCNKLFSIFFIHLLL